MSNSHSTSAEEPSDSRTLFSAIAWVGVILIFVFIVWVAYLPNRPGPIDQAVIDRRIAIRKKVAAEQHTAISTYGWVDQGKGIVRLPIEEAMSITIQRLNKDANMPVSPVGTAESAATVTN
ncbi:MAG: hypothetical protein SFY80_13535 [Verrucomicrobiota bacterium]|nr:hypothetical protein [Verrucomicrobiota bacterium]